MFFLECYDKLLSIVGKTRLSIWICVLVLTVIALWEGTKISYIIIMLLWGILTLESTVSTIRKMGEEK